MTDNIPMTEELPINFEGKPCYHILLRTDFTQLREQLLKAFGSQKPHRICVVTDSNVEGLYLSEIMKRLEPDYDEVLSHVFTAGEDQKQLSTVEELYEDLIFHHFDRNDAMIALGGGVTGDLTGFAASSYLRGIRFVQIPTTLLSQVDSSIGGKTGVDFRQYKNMVGAFYMPSLVYINTAVLASLPEEQFASGMGEVIKHGLILNRSYYDFLKENKEPILSRDSLIMMQTVLGSCRIKGEVVEKDPKEKNIRALLNFGHTIGHAVEKCAGFRMTHGACVAIGMAAAVEISASRGYLAPAEVFDIKKTIESFRLPTVVPTEIADFTAEDIVRTTHSDKKRIGSSIRFVLLKSPGEAVIDTSVTDKELFSAAESILP